MSHGFQLRVTNGPMLAASDPLLAAFAVGLTQIARCDRDDEALQHEGFDPGRELHLTAEPDADGDDTVGVWDADHIRKAGTLQADDARRAIAAIEWGLTYRALALQEARARPDDRRAALTVLLFAEDFVCLSQKAGVPQLVGTLSGRGHRLPCKSGV